MPIITQIKCEECPTLRVEGAWAARGWVSVVLSDQLGEKRMSEYRIEKGFVETDSDARIFLCSEECLLENYRRWRES